MLNASVQLFFLRELPFAHFDFPRWQAVLAISLLGLLASFDPSLRAVPPGLTPPPIALIAPAILLGMWSGFLVFLGILKPWLRRGGRWDGQGDLFNLLAASWLVADALIIGLTNLSVPIPFVLPLGLYSFWVFANALTSAIPGASLGYCFAGIFLCLLPAVAISGIVIVLVGTVSLYLGDLLGMLPAAA